MSVVNLRERTILAKVVYYGPPLGGKTTSLKQVHRVMDPEQRTRLLSLNTDNDRTLFFDFLPINLGRIGDFSLKIQGFTVPGQVRYRQTRRYVLRGADAVVFVADSRGTEREGNRGSLEDLRENLAVHGLSADTVPLVLQFNKRDEPDAMPVADLESLLNGRGVPAFETVATAGTGVFEAFAAAAAGMVERICRDYRLGDAAEASAAVRATLERIHEASGVRAGAPPPALGAEEAPLVVVGEDAGGEGTPPPEDLLERALGANVRVAELLSEVQEARAALESRVAELTALQRVSGAASASLDEDRVVAAVVEGAAAALGVSHASLLLRDEEDGPIRERGVHGLVYDPLAAAGAPAAGASPLRTLMDAPGPVLVDGSGPPGILEAIREREPAVSAAVAAPLRVRGESRGLLVVYYAGSGLPPPGGTARRFLGALAAGASVALENARLHGELERFNRRLEATVTERTRELEAAYRDLKELDRLKDDFLSNMSHELMTPLSGIRSSAEILRTYGDLEATERAEFVEGIEREARRLNQRLQDILDLAAFDAGKARLSKSPADPVVLAREAVERARPSLAARSLRASVRGNEGGPPVPLDPRWMARALDHLLDNAAKFSPEGGEVEVAVERAEGGLRVAVRDRGPGIPVEERESLFHRFKQIGSVLTDKPPGIGAGLPLCRRVVEAHGGTIGIEGGPGRGTEVRISLPEA